MGRKNLFYRSYDKFIGNGAFRKLYLKRRMANDNIFSYISSNCDLSQGKPETGFEENGLKSRRKIMSHFTNLPQQNLCVNSAVKSKYVKTHIH